MQAQVWVNKEWVQLTGLPDTLAWSASALELGGNVIVVGNTQVTPGDPDVLVTKYSSGGTLLWQQTFEGTGNGPDYGTAVAIAPSGDIVVAAAVTNTGNNMDMAVLRYSSGGTLLWSSSWNGAGNQIDVPTSIKLHGNAEAYVAGTSYASAIDLDFALVKFSYTGSVLWSSYYDYAGLIDVATGVELDSIGQPIVTGASAAAIDTWDFAALKFDATDGAPLDTIRVSAPGAGIDQATEFRKDPAGNLYITGSRQLNGQRDMQTVKLTSAFALAWVANYDGGNGDDIARTVASDNSGTVYVAGQSANASGGTDMTTCKYDASGNQVWTKRITPQQAVWQAGARKMAVTTDGGVVVSGTIFNGTSKDLITVKYDAAGKLLWTKTYDGLDGSEDEALGLLTDANGNVFVSGRSTSTNGAVYTTVKYSAYRREPTIASDTSGTMHCVADEVIIRFANAVVDSAFTATRDRQWGALDEVVDPAVALAVEQCLGYGATGPGPIATKMYRQMVITDTFSISRGGDTLRMPKFWNTFVVGTPPGADLDSVLARLDSLAAASGSLLYASRNVAFERFWLPDDPLLYRQQSLVPDQTYPNAHINMEDAWDIQKGRPEVRVGIVDEPVDGNHEDFGDNLMGWYEHGLDEPWMTDYNAWYGEPFGYHGTACAGIIGASSNNGIGIAGIAGGDDNSGGCALISVVIAAYGQYNSLVDIAAAIVAASGDLGDFPDYLGCHILNNSYGVFLLDPPYYAQSPALAQAVWFAYRNECSFVAARGNWIPGSVQQITTISYPANYGGGELPDNGVLTIGASGSDGEYMRPGNNDGIGYSMYGGLDVIAPGTVKVVTSTMSEEANFIGCESLPEGYDCFRGTSAAAPHVAGVAALMMSEHSMANGAYNDLCPEDVEMILEKTATDIVNIYQSYPVGYDPKNGWGRVDAGAALEQVSEPYWLYHSEDATAATYNTVPGQTFQIGDGLFSLYQPDDWGLTTGTYTADRVETVLTYHVLLDPSAEIIDHWVRESAHIGFDDDPFSFGNHHVDYTFTYVNAHEVIVTATTNAWHLTNGPDGPVNQWLPDVPTKLRGAFSLHVHGPGLIVTGMEEPLEDISLVYPNPVSEVLNVTFPKHLGAIERVSIVDAVGRVVLDRPLRGAVARLSLPVANLTAGTYNLRYIGSHEVSTTKFIKY